MGKRKKHASHPRPPTKKELYYLTTVKIRCRIAVATEIRDRLRPGSARLDLFRGTCFGPWLDVQATSKDSSLVHLMLQTEYTPTPAVHQDALFFRVGGRELRFGPQEFCLITGMRFGPHNWKSGRADMTFKERVFGHLKARPKVLDLKDVFDRSLDRLSDLDAVRVCLLMLVEVGFMAGDPRVPIDSILLELVEDLDSWNTFPWGSHIWKVVYRQLHNALTKRSVQRDDITLGYSLSGFIWAFKMWIFEVFPYAKRFATKHGGIPRAISWGKSKFIPWKLALPFVMDATVPGFEPLPVLTPTPAERATEWWRESCQFFDGYANDSSPLLKKVRLSSPPQPLVRVHEQLAEDITDTTTMSVEYITGTTTMPRSDNTTNHQSTPCRENTEKTMLDTQVDELYYANLKVKNHIAVATEIRDRLRPGSARSELFRGTCFGPWLDIQSTSSDPSLVHLILQTEYTPNPDMHQDALFFRVGGQELRFGPQEFCLITGLRFGPHHWEYGRADMTFRERVFGHVQARPRVSDLKNIFNLFLDQLSDLDAVRICLLILVEVGFKASDYRLLVDLILLELVEDLDSWNTFPWGSYVWRDVYKKLHNALAKRSIRRRDTPLDYWLSGFIWAFKIWIFEAFPYAKNFAIKHGGIPRAISWGKNKFITWKLALPFVTDATVPGLEPLPELTPTPEECATDWWQASCQFFADFANDSSPLLNKERLSSPSQPSLVFCDPLTEDIADTATMPVNDIADTAAMPLDDIADITTMPLDDIADTTTMPSSDNSTSQQSAWLRANMEKTTVENKLQKPLVMTCVTNYEDCIDDLWEAREPHCIKTEMPTTSDLLCPFDHVEDHVVAGKVSSQSDTTCVQGYEVKQSVAPILESIFKKYGDIAADCIYKPASMRSSFLETICEVVSQIQTNDDIDEMEGLEQQVLVAEAANINVSWLQVHLDAIRKRKEASRRCSLLMEMKENTGLVKNAALMDLRESFEELMAAQERFEKAERCVRVLNLVEKNLNDNILESKGNIDSGSRQPVL